MLRFIGILMVIVWELWFEIFVIGDSVVGTMAGPIRYSGGVTGAELMSIILGVGFCQQRDLINICIFSDSLNAINLIVK